MNEHRDEPQADGGSGGISAEDLEWLSGGRQSEVSIVSASDQQVEQSNTAEEPEVVQSVQEPPAVVETAHDLDQSQQLEDSDNHKPGQVSDSVWGLDRGEVKSSPVASEPVEVPANDLQIFVEDLPGDPPSSSPKSVGSLGGVVETGLGNTGVLGGEGSVDKLSAQTKQIKRTRRARLRLTRVDPWSVMKTSFLFSIAGAIILVLAVWLLWTVINVSGVLEAVESAINDIVANPESDTKFLFRDYISQGRVLGLTTIIAASNVVIITALATLFAFLYNLSAQILGGIELTLAED